MAKKQTLGFGFDPAEAQQHFLVVSYPARSEKKVVVYERFVWDDGDTQYTGLPATLTKNYKVHDELAANKGNIDLLDNTVRTKIILSPHKWNMVRVAIESEFNRTLKAENKLVGRFKVGQVPVERLLGKEMLVLLWAIEDCDPSVIPNAIKNWLGLSREERWWLFTMTNAVTGGADDKRGWRKALRYAITENPIPDKNTSNENLFDSLSQNI